MSKLLIRVDNHDQPYTVSEMRKRLAQVLSKLNGDQEVAFTFVATLEHYQPRPIEETENCTLEWFGLQPVIGELARPEND